MTLGCSDSELAVHVVEALATVTSQICSGFRKWSTDFLRTSVPADRHAKIHGRPPVKQFETLDCDAQPASPKKSFANIFNEDGLRYSLVEALRPPT